MLVIVRAPVIVFEPRVRIERCARFSPPQAAFHTGDAITCAFLRQTGLPLGDSVSLATKCCACSNGSYCFVYPKYLWTQRSPCARVDNAAAGTSLGMCVHYRSTVYTWNIVRCSLRPAQSSRVFLVVTLCVARETKSRTSNVYHANRAKNTTIWLAASETVHRLRLVYKNGAPKRVPTGNLLRHKIDGQESR